MDLTLSFVKEAVRCDVWLFQLRRSSSRAQRKLNESSRPLCGDLWLLTVP